MTYRNEKLRAAAKKEAAARRERTARERRPIEQVKVNARERVQRLHRDLFTFEDACDWCGRDPEDPTLTARILVQPGRYSAAGRMEQKAIYAYACFDHTRQLKLLGVDTRNKMIEDEKYRASVRADVRNEHRAAQDSLFPDERNEPTNPIMKDS